MDAAPANLPLVPPSPSKDGDSASWAFHAGIMLGCSAACIAWSWWAGRDLNWDQLNYHFYAAYHFLDDRLARDFMGASVQGYLNPLAYVPFYLMVRADWHSLLIGSTLALLHSTCLWLTYGIAWILLPAGTRHRRGLIVASVVLAFLAPLYLAEVGSSFIDVTTTIPVLFGILLLMKFQQQRSGGALVVAAGVLMGSAAALKLTNVVFAVAAAVFVVFAAVPLRQRLQLLAGYVAGGAAGFLLVDGAWAYRLFRMFGNPFFPWFNAWFRSPDFPAFNIQHHRFVAEGLADYLSLPIRILELAKSSYAEIRAPDIRFVALFVILLAAAAAVMIRRRARSPDAAELAPSAFPANRVFAAAVAFTLCCYVLWLATSGNGRYAIPLELFMGPMIPASVLAIGASVRVSVYLIGAILLVQAAIVNVGAAPRWLPTEWKSRWFDLDVPEVLKARPFLFLSLNKQTNVFLAPFMNPESSFVSLFGQVSLALDRPGGTRLRALVDRHQPNIRTLLLPSIPTRGAAPNPAVITFQNNILKRLDLQVDPTDCLPITLHDSVAQIPESVSGTSDPVKARAAEVTNYLTCGTVPLRDAIDTPEFKERQAKTDRAFAILEATCPRLFSPAGMVTDHVNSKLGRAYFNSDANVWELGGKLEYEGWRFDSPVPLGTVDALLDGRTRLDCGSIRAPDFGPGK
ncbi:MAG: hypothetical protein ABI724_07520 [Betaproteobacteria bacterium]